MSSPNPNEVWQVEVGGQVYEAPFRELGDWIGEGSLLPEDKVRKGNLRWVAAKHVPTLVPFFNAKQQGRPMPVMFTTSEAETPSVETPVEVVSDSSAVVNAAPVEFAPPFVPADPVETAPPFAPAEPVEHTIAVPAEPVGGHPNPDHCALHGDVPSVFVCDGCGNGFCKVCPKSYGGSVRICPLCGAMCKTFTEVVQKKTVTEQRTNAIQAGFGAGDFFNALSHPFKFKASLFFGALMFAAFSLGQSVNSLGGVYMMVSAIFCWMLANMLTFGVLANTIDSFAHGDLEANFMPSFDDFELWDDVIHPFFLSIGAYISAFGPFLLVMIIGTYFVVSSVNSEMETFGQRVEKIPGSHSFDTKRTLDQSNAVKNVLGDVTEKHQQQIEDYEDAASGNTDSVVEDETAPVEDQSARETREQEELWKMAQDGQKKQLESVLGKSPETEAKENQAFVQSFLALAAPLVVIGGIFLLWGLFYFPIACAIAGYTRSFSATLNPLVGLDTIKRLGGTYVSLVFMEIVLLVASLIVSGILAVILSPLDLPMFGNIPAKFIGGIFGFYLWVVFSCVIGYAMYKKSDALHLG